MSDQTKTLNELLALIRDDGYAISFQSLGQYRVALANEVKRQVRDIDRAAVTGNAGPKLHYYAFAFSSGDLTASVYIGWSDLPVTLAKINEARDGSGIPKPSAMVGCSYLGYMTHNEMMGEG